MWVAIVILSSIVSFIVSGLVVHKIDTNEIEQSQAASQTPARFVPPLPDAESQK